MTVKHEGYKNKTVNTFAGKAVVDEEGYSDASAQVEDILTRTFGFNKTVRPVVEEPDEIVPDEATPEEPKENESEKEDTPKEEPVVEEKTPAKKTTRRTTRKTVKKEETEG